MIQFNLLPDVKLEFIKAQRTKRVVMVISALIAGISLAVFIALLVTVKVFQQRHLSNLNQDIKRDSQKLKEMPEIDKILTVQNQLGSLPDLHNKKPVVSRLFGYLSQITPGQVSIAKLTVDFDAHVMTIDGDTDSLSTINKFVDTIKFTDFVSSTDTSKQTKAFSSVVLSNFGRDDKGATYKITLAFDPAIFDSASDITLTVPKIITTRSEIQKPSELFQQQTEQDKPN